MIALVPDRDGSGVALVVKMPRLAEDTAGIEHEAAVLSDLAARWPQGRATFPEIRELRLSGGHPALVETAVDGAVLTHRAVARHPVAAVRAVGHWVESLPITGSTGTDANWYVRLVQKPLERLASDARDVPEMDDLVRDTLALAAPLQRRGLPLVFEHGDVTHPNLFINDTGAVAAVDWELAEPAGLPGTDFLHFLAFVAFAVGGSHDVSRQVQAFDDAFFGSRPWAAVMARAHLRKRGVDESVLEPLLVATWARYAAQAAPRLHHLAATAAPGSNGLLAHVVQSDRDVAIWRSLVVRGRRALHPSINETEWQWAI